MPFGLTAPLPSGSCLPEPLNTRILLGQALTTLTSAFAERDDIESSRISPFWDKFRVWVIAFLGHRARSSIRLVATRKPSAV